MKVSVICCFVLPMFVAGANQEHVLMLPHSSSASHVRLFYKLAEKLVVRGHKVTLLNYFMIENLNQIDIPKNVNVVVIPCKNTDVPENFGSIIDEWLWKPADSMWDLLYVLTIMVTAMGKPCIILDDNPDLRSKLQNLNVTLGVLDPVAHACAGVVMNFLNVPYINYSPLRSVYPVEKAVGSPCPFSYVFCMFGYSDANLAVRALDIFGHYGFEWWLSVQLVIVGMFVPKHNDWNVDTSMSPDLVMINTNNYFESARPYSSAHLNVEQFRKPADYDMPENLKDFVDDPASKGTILFSMSTFTSSAQMPDYVKSAFLEAFRRFPNHRFVWRLEPDFPAASIEPNIRILPWIPQQALLAHSKTRLIITHGGMNSVLEAISNGVPILAVPMFGDQHVNTQMVKRQGFGLILNKVNIGVDNIETMIKEILSNESFANKMKTASKMTNDHHDLRSHQDPVVWWVEHLLRHKNQKSWRIPKGAHLSTIQYFDLDIMALAVGFLISVLFVVCKILSAVWKWLLNS